MSLLLLAACSTPQERTAEAQADAAEAAAEVSKLEAEYRRRRFDKIEEYEDCVEDAEPETVGSCDRILKTIELMQ